MIKFSRTAANQSLSAPDSAALTFPNSDWVLSFVVTFDGLTSGDNPQYIFSNANFQAAGSLNVAYNTLGAASNQGKMLIYSGTVAAPVIVSTTSYSSGTHLFVLQRSGTTLSLRSCPILAIQPVDGSAVVAQPTTTLNTALDGAGFKIAARNDLLAARFNDQSLGRMFRFDGTLTDLEVANLAFGKQVTDIGKTPAWYVRMSSISDYSDLGAQANVITLNGSPTTSAEPAYGFVPGNVAPAFTTSPAIIGTPQVNSATSYTAGTVTGNPTPTRTQQWTLDGIDISGATGATYTPVVGDIGKALRVRQIETNIAGSANSTSSPVTVIAEASGTIDVNDVTANKIYQRIGTSAPIALSGTYTGATPSTIEAQLYAADGTTVLQAWTALTATTINGGTWTGTLTANQGGMYRLAVRAGAAVSATKTNLWGVGALIGFIGSSSAEKLFNYDSGTGKTAAANTRKYNESGWQLMGTDGAGIEMINALSSTLGVPVAALDYGIGGTTLAQWVTTNYSGFNSFKTGVTNVGGKLEAMYSSVGSNDGATGIVVSLAQHIANLRLLISNTRAHAAQANLPWIISGTNGRTSANNAQFDMLRNGEKTVGADANNSYTQTVDLPVANDAIHLTPAGFSTSGLRAAAIIGPVMAGTTLRKGPRISSIVYSGSTADVNLTYPNGGTDFTPTTGITGFAASDTSGTLNISSAVRSTANKILLTFNRAIVAPLDVNYLEGSRPIVTGAVLDNGTVPLPLDVELQLTPVAAGAFSANINIVEENDVLVMIGAVFNTQDSQQVKYFRMIAKQFASVPTATVEEWLAIAAMFTNTGCLEGDKKDFAIALYAAHLMYLDDLNTQGSGGRGYIKSEREGDLSRTYGGGYTGDDSWYGLSPYGQQYLNITAGCFGSGIMTRFGNGPFPAGAAPWADDVYVGGQPRNLYND